MILSTNNKASHKLPQGRRSFTLVEMLLVVSLISVIGLAVYHTLFSGLKIWERRPQSTTQEDLLIFFDKIGQDLENTMDYSKIPFQGDERKISFATLVRVPIDNRKAAQKNELVKQIGKVEYYLDGSKKTIFRKQANYSQALKKQFFPARDIVHDIQSMKFVYYYRSLTNYVTTNKTNGETPSLISVEINFNDGRGTEKVTRVFNIPIGN